MKALLLLTAFAFASAVNGQPNDAPTNVPVGSIDTFYCASYYIFQRWDSVSGQYKNDSSFLIEAWAFEWVDDRILVPYVGKGGPCRPSGSAYWKERYRAMNWWQMTNGIRIWFPAWYTPSKLHRPGDDFVWPDK